MYKLYEQNDFDFSLLNVSPVIYISDIDETYLRTDFKTLWGILNTAVQFAIDKIAYPDMTLFFQAIKRHPASVLYFISASPIQMKTIFRHTFLLKEISYDGLILRDMLHLLLAGYRREIKNPFGYKLFAIFNLLKTFPSGSNLVLLGDDTEADQGVYETVKGFLDNTLTTDHLKDILCKHHVSQEHIADIVESSQNVSPTAFQIVSIFIHQTKSSPSQTTDLRSNTIFFKHPKEIIESLHEQGLLTSDQKEHFFNHMQRRE